MICAKCQQPIRDGEDYDAIAVHSPSAAGSTMHLHKTCPPKPQA